jgi:peptidoglycan/xylan/chitin deacetylase (PgdA/CDA1 family)
MRRRREPVPRARAAAHWLGGFLVLGILGGGVVSAAVLLWENLDVRQLAPGLAATPTPLPPPLPPVAAGVEPRDFDVVLFRSARNEFFFPETDYYAIGLEHWGAIIESVGGTVREIGSLEDLRAVAPSELLVVPMATCLSNAEIDALGAHTRAGGSLVSNWALGARDERCAWRGWETVGRFTGAGDVRELGARDALFLTVPSGTPLSLGMDPGTRIELVPEPPLALNISGPRVYWSDWALNPAPDESGGKADVAAVAGRTDAGGRTSWFGFRLSQAATPQDKLLMERLVGNGILWAAGLASASPAPWPDGSRAALVLVEDVEAEYPNAAAMAALLQEEEVPGTFYVVSQLVRDEAALAEQLVSAGEVGSHTSDHQPVTGLDSRDQFVRLRRSRDEIRRWTGVSPSGFRPPEEVFDANTLDAWAEAGGSYILAVNQSRSGSPELHPVGDGEVVLMPRLIKDDYNVFVQDGAGRPERLTEAFLEGMGKMRAMGGLAVVVVHTQIVGTNRRLESIRTVIDTAKVQGGWWMARAGDVADWWMRRGAVRVTMLPPEADSAAPELAVGDTVAHTARGFPVVRVEAPTGTGIARLWVDVVLPVGPNSAAPFVDGVPISYSTTEWGIRVPVGDLSAGETRVIHLRPAEEG